MFYMINIICLAVTELLLSVQSLVNRVVKEHRLPPRQLECYSVPAVANQTKNSCGVLSLFGSILRYVFNIPLHFTYNFYHFSILIIRSLSNADHPRDILVPRTQHKFVRYDYFGLYCHLAFILIHTMD